MLTSLSSAKVLWLLLFGWAIALITRGKAFIVSGKVDHAMNMVWIRFSRLEGLINVKDLLADVLKLEKPELPVDYELINAWIFFSHLDSLRLYQVERQERFTGWRLKTRKARIVSEKSTVCVYE